MRVPIYILKMDLWYFSFLINFESCRLKFHLPWMDPRCRSNGSRYCSWKFGVDALKLRPSAVLPWW